MDKEYLSLRVFVGINLDYLEEIEENPNLFEEGVKEDVEYNLFKWIDYIKWKGWLELLLKDFNNRKDLNKFIKGDLNG